MEETPVQRRIRERLEEHRRRQAESGDSPLVVSSSPSVATPNTAAPSQWAEFASAVPQVLENVERSEVEVQIDQTLENLGVLEAYQRYINKMVPKVGSKREGIMISCPLPDHPDRDPSAWMNLDNNTWFCGGCQVGGDQFDLAAIHFGYDSTTYKQGQNWGIFRKTLAQDLGLVIEYIPGVGEVSYASESEPDSEAEDQTLISTAPSQAGGSRVLAPPPPVAGGGPDGVHGQVSGSDSVAASGVPASVVGATGDAKQSVRDAESLPAPPPLGGHDSSGVHSSSVGTAQAASSGGAQAGPDGLDWRPLCPPGTFLSEFMKAVTIDDVPEEYHFWHAMMGLGLTVGRDVKLVDNPAVFGNLFVCLLGKTGSGKSKAKRYIAEVMHEAAPWDANVNTPTGVKMIPTPASAEAMIKAFQREYVAIDAAGRQYKAYAPIRGFVEFAELKSLTSRMNRTGSAIQPTLIEFFDAGNSVSSVATSKDGERYAYQPLASVLTTVQPEVLSEVFTESDEASGFLNRWLFCTGTPKPKQLFNRNVIQLGDAIILMRKIHTWGSKTRNVVWSKEAETLFEKAWFGYIQHDVDANSMSLARIDLMIKKLGLIFAINEMSETVTEEMLERVLKIYPYLIRNVRFKAESMMVSGDSAMDDAIVAAVKKLGPGLHSGRDITRKIERKYRTQGQIVIDRHLQALGKSGYLRIHTITPGKGRPSIRYEGIE